MAERPIITEAQARAECRRVGIVPDDWRKPADGPRIYAWQDVQQQMTVGLASTGATAMKIEWTDEACEALTKTYRKSPYSFGDGTGYRRILAREMLDAATAVQFAPETDAEKIRRYEEAMREALTALAQGPAGAAPCLLKSALSYRKGA